MATPVTFGGVSYSIPAYGDVGYAQGPGNLSSYLIALSNGVQTTGGLFSLTAPLNFGPNFGILAVNFSSTSANPATAGQIRLANTDTIDWRNFANSGNLALGVNASDQLIFNGSVISTAAIGGIVSTGTAGRLALYPATGNTVDDIYIQSTFGIDILIAAQSGRSVAIEYTIPNPGNAVAAATFALLQLAQTFTATQTFAAATFTGLITGDTETLSGLLTLAIPSASAVNILIANTTNTQNTFIAQSTGAAFVTSHLASNQNPITNVFTKTGQGSSILYCTSSSGSGTVSINASSVNNVAATLCATLSDVGCSLKGTTTNNNAAAGFIGEYIESVVAGVNFPATTVYGDLTSISLTAGDWEVTSQFSAAVGTATGITQFITGISVTPGNSGAGLSLGNNRADTIAPIGNFNSSIPVSGYRQSLSATTTIYLKFRMDYATGQPTAFGRLSARRMR